MQLGAYGIDMASGASYQKASFSAGGKNGPTNRRSDRGAFDSMAAGSPREHGRSCEPGSVTDFRAESLTDPRLLNEYAARNRAAGGKLRTPVASKFAQMIRYLLNKRGTRTVISRERSLENPGIPDLFLYRLDAQQRVYGGYFVEVKRRTRKREPARLCPQVKERKSSFSETWVSEPRLSTSWNARRGRADARK